MYNSFKSLINILIPRRTLFGIEPYLRSIYALSFKGKKYQCTVCRFELKKFIELKNHEKLCPKCGSLSRDRKLYSLLSAEFIKEDQEILDFSPSRCLSRKMKLLKNNTYKSSDLSGNFIADYQYDITAIAAQSETFDLIICYHILEHIEEDSKSMNELFRVLKPNGKIIIQTPFKEGDIYENPLITTPQEREIHFGQDDHVRIYSENGLKSRLENAGFKTEIRHFTEEENNYNGFCEKEIVFVISK